MRRYLLLAVSVALVLGLFALASSRDGTLSVRVRPAVSAKRHSPRDLRALHKVIWHADKRVTLSSPALGLTPDQPLIHPQPLATLFGRVVKASGEPVAGAPIDLLRDGEQQAKLLATSTEAGTFAAKDLLAGEGVIFSENDEGLLAVKRLHLAPGQPAQVTLELKEPDFYFLKGRVVDETGAGVGQVLVQAVSQRSPPSNLDRVLADRFATTRTWENGYFDLMVAAPDWYRVELREERGGPLLLEARLFPTQDEDYVSLVIPEKQVVTCQLLDAEGQPLELQSYALQFRGSKGHSGCGGTLSAHAFRFLWRSSWDELKVTLYGEEHEATLTLTSPDQLCQLQLAPVRTPAPS